MPKRTTQDATMLKAVKTYVREQIKTMKAHGAAKNLSAEAVNEMVNKVAAATK
jgi:hypothetical protein